MRNLKFIVFNDLYYVASVCGDLPTCNNDKFLTCFHMGSWMLFCHRKINNASAIPLKKKQNGKKPGKLCTENPTKNAKL